MTPEQAIRILDSETSLVAIEELKYYAGFNRDKVIDQIQEAMDMGAEALRETMWIPCSERLPVPNEFAETGHFFKAYLVQDKRKTMYTALWDGKWWTIWTRGIVINNVVAWMPLPEPYKENIEEKVWTSR